MSAAATPIGASAPPVVCPQPGPERHDWTGFASGDGAKAKREAKHLAGVGERCSGRMSPPSAETSSTPFRG